MTAAQVHIIPVTGIPEVGEGDDLGALIAASIRLQDGDVVVVAQKIVSKAEGAVVRVDEGEAMVDARARLARMQASRVIADSGGVLVVQTHHGLVCANAGIDASNAMPGTLLLLPEDPDASARRLRSALMAVSGAHLAVVVTDTFGRAWRTGQTDVAIGLAGIAGIRDERSRVDRSGRELRVTAVAVVDEIAAAADLVRRKAEGVPVVVIRGLDWDADDGARAAQLVRSPDTDLFLRGRGELRQAMVAPEPLRPVDQIDLQHAIDAARTVVGNTVRFDVAGSGGRWSVHPLGDRPADAHVPATADDAPDAVLGAAAAVLFAVLIDAGHAARLVLDPAPAVLVESTIAGHHELPVVSGKERRGRT